MTARLVSVAAVLAGVAASLALVRGGYTVPDELVAPTLVLSLAVAWSFVGVGLVARRRRPDSRTGVLMVVFGFAWLARFVVAVDTTPAFVAGVLLGSVALSVFVQLLVTFPTGRTESTAQRVLVGVGWLLSVPLDAVFLAVGAQRGRGDGPPPNGLVITPSGGEFRPDVVDLTVQAVVVVLLMSVLVSVWLRWRASGPAARRALTPGLVGGTIVVGTLLVERTAILLLLPPSAGVWLAWSAQVVLVVWPAALLLGLLRSRLDRSGVGRLVVELGGAGAGVGTDTAPEHLRSVVARTLHDPTVELVHRLPGTEDYVDPAGARVEVGSRAVTFLERDGEPIAALLHDPALTAEPDLVEAVAAGAGLALENERLHAEVRHQLREVRASRARLVEAADAARRRVERDLHDGAQQRLVAVGLALRLARNESSDQLDALLAEAADELTAALAELRELARGIYPPLLTDGGLAPALLSLAERAPLPVVLTDVPADRPPETVERTCYFVVSEALTNAAKHAAATKVEVSVVPEGDGLRVEVVDDGLGGADADGSGLRGLADRVAALGGSLRVESPAGRGTRVTASVPCG
ncbi:histidine kinase/DNA gyrase B/HSP90-like ATPase [Actinomycetospora succinea]|uniref:histidine kinase n=1 Tax=Actinomycetospora succinea TaxID=663603 RepID=A0A4R6UP88_9PSEU|nr:sensor histidine kinase [Actinomycetospora succinea]TDQ49010.1 histidine kinase/DNA gyrase B/HSP90-like ATPase [Actinomycetospora succinea]